MKKIIYLLLFIMAFSIISISSYAQKPDHELTEEEAIQRIEEFQFRVGNLTKALQDLDADILKLEAELEETKLALKECNDALYAMLGVTEDDIIAYRQQLGVIEGKIRNMQRLSNDELADKQNEVKALEAELNALRGNKIACLPEFYNKIIALAKDIRGLYREKKVTTYIVGTWAENRDCLWNIAGKMDIYGDPFLWPKVWQANTDIIRNPDIIYPGWVLKIPPKAEKTDVEKKAERRYWREKRERMELETGLKGE
jgi:nucleoid-associated protein YgaU